MIDVLLVYLLVVLLFAWASISVGKDYVGYWSYRAEIVERAFSAVQNDDCSFREASGYIDSAMDFYKSEHPSQRYLWEREQRRD